MVETNPNPYYEYIFRVTQESLDENGHVNNVQFVKWMQEAAVHHYESMGGIPPTEEIGATWVVRSHKITYLQPAYLGDEIEVRTWVANLRRVRSLRKYEFIRVSDRQTMVRGETDWVFVDAKTGNPMSIPPTVARVFTILDDD